MKAIRGAEVTFSMISGIDLTSNMGWFLSTDHIALRIADRIVSCGSGSAFDCLI